MHPLVEPHFDSAALLTIDVQADTLDGGPLEIAGTSAAVPRIVGLCQAFRDTGLPIVHIVRIYRADGSNAEPVRKDLVSGPAPGGARSLEPCATSISATITRTRS